MRTQALGALLRIQVGPWFVGVQWLPALASHPAALQPTPIGTVHTDLPSQTQPRDKAQLYSKNQVRSRAKDPNN